MRGKVLGAVLLLAVMSAGLSDALSKGQAGHQEGIGEPKLAVLGSPNATYEERMNLALARYSEDLNYSRKILDEYVKKNLTDDEAFVATVSIFTLASQTLDEVEGIKPPERYAAYHNYSLQALANLKGYLWNLAKFCETGEVDYVAEAREHFNLSLSYYEKEQREAKRIS
jgi:hypothetical protein